ncbi:MAG: amidase [Bacilli bacterium]
MDYLAMTLVELHKCLVNKEITPLELVKVALEELHASPDNAIETFNDEEALKEASLLVEPEVDNIFWGIPVCVKDNIATKDLLTTASSEILKDYVPVFDATVVKKLKDAKAIIIAKTTLDELAMGGTGMTGHKGYTYNPWDPSHKKQVGGSSAGSATVVSAGIVPFALGSDTGDSIRKPASYAGLVGMKPTWSRISRFGLFPFATSLDHIGYFTRSVEDAAYALNLLAGRDLNDSTSSTKPVDDYTSLLGTSIEGKNIAVIDEIVDSIQNKTIVNAFNDSLKALEKLGAKINHTSIPANVLKTILPTYMIISNCESASNNACLDGIKYGPRLGGNSYEEVMINARTKGFSPAIKRRFVIGSFCLLKENQEELFKKAQRMRHYLVNLVNQILETNDVIYLPAAPSTAYEFTHKADQLSDEYLIADNHMALGNFAGLPSITVPLGFEEGMPFGVNFMGKAFKEVEVFQFASALESTTNLKNLSVKKVNK